MHAEEDEQGLNGLAALLSGGDRRSTGRSDEVSALVLAKPALFQQLIRGMSHSDPLIRMRAADAAEKVTVQRPELLQPHKRRLLHRLAVLEQQEVRWHVAQMLPRLELNPAEREMAVEILLGYLDDKSKIVKTFTMQALADLAQQDPGILPQILPILIELTESGSPAMQSRGRKILAQFARKI